MRARTRRRAFEMAFSALLLGAVSCSTTYHGMVESAREAFQNGSLVEADRLLTEQLAEYDEGDGEWSFLLLESSLVQLASGDAARAEATLRRVRDVFDEIDREDFAQLSSDISAYFTDDRSRAYSGEDYEKVLIRVFLSLANLLQEGEDSVAYANQILEKQRQIRSEELTLPDGSVERLKAEYKQVGVGDYLYGLVTELDPTASSEALVSYRRVQEFEPQFTAVSDDIERLEGSRLPQAGNGAVYVFAMVGRGPEKVEVVEAQLTIAGEIALQFIRFIDVIGEHFGPTLDLSPMRISDIQARQQNIDDVAVFRDGEEVGVTETLADITSMAVQQFEANRPYVLARAIVRRMAKKAITTAAKGAASIALEESDAPGWSNILLEVGGSATNTVWSAVERADTRQWALLPDKIQVTRLELPAGTHELSLTPRRNGRTSGAARPVRVSVRSGANTYVLGFFPDSGGGPMPVVSGGSPRMEFAP